MYFDPMYLVFMAPALLLAFFAQMKVRSAYGTYTKVANSRGMTGLDAARVILGPEGLNHVQVEGTPGQLTDHYDPRSKKLRLSAGVAQQPSVAALAIVAHEIGHALQDNQGYAPLKLRGAIVPAVSVSAWVAPILFFAGLLLGLTQLAWVGVILQGAKAVLDAAALTYVAALAQTLATLLYYVSFLGRQRD